MQRHPALRSFAVLSSLVSLLSLSTSATVVAAQAMAQTRVARAASAGAHDSINWAVNNHGRDAGDLTAVTRGDSLVVRWIFIDRNRGTRIETRYKLGANRRPVSGESRPVLADGTLGDAFERFAVAGDSVEIHTGTTRTVVARQPDAFVGLRGGTPYESAAFARYLLAQPGHAGRNLGAGPAHVDVIADTTLPTVRGRQRARLVMVYRGTNLYPQGLWLDANGALLSTDAQWFITVRRGSESLLPAMRAIELKWRNAQGDAMARKVVSAVSGALVIRNGDLFDSERGVVRAKQTVVVKGDRIIAVGPADSVQTPPGSTVIDATGKTIMPGMWEMHTHLQVSNQSNGSLIQLAQGLTTVRDLASDVDVAVSQRDRERAGRLASPRVILAGFIEGPLKWAGPSATVVSTEAEAQKWVARYDSMGYKQIKLYNVVHPDLVPVIAAEAKKRGMLLSGHIPRGLSVQAAVTLGFDEIQHAAFLFSTFYPDSIWLPQMRAYSQVATAVAPTIDVDGAPMTALINFLRDHHTVIDGTFNLWIGGGGALVGAGGSTDQLKADSAYMKLIRRLYAAGVTLVAGTDNSTGVTYRRELEMYERAGIPVPTVLQIATIVAARFMKEDRDYGSITAGKVADLIVVNGKPAEHIADLQKVETVVRGGRLYKVTDLQAATGTAPSAQRGDQGVDEGGDAYDEEAFGALPDARADAVRILGLAMLVMHLH